MCDDVDTLRLVLVHLPPAKLRLSRTVARPWDAAADASCLWQAHHRWVRFLVVPQTARVQQENSRPSSVFSLSLFPSFPLSRSLARTPRAPPPPAGRCGGVKYYACACTNTNTQTQTHTHTHTLRTRDRLVRWSRVTFVWVYIFSLSFSAGASTLPAARPARQITFRRGTRGHRGGEEDGRK
jgi:hypothetical protein